MASSFYTLTITNPGGSPAAPNDGFIDNVTTQNYISNLVAPPGDFTLVLATAKRRANLRYQRLVATLNYTTNCIIDTRHILATGAAYNSPPTTFTFTVWIEHGDTSLYTPDETTTGTFLSGTSALKRMASRALVYNNVATNADIFDPTLLATIGNTAEIPRLGVRTMFIAIGPVVSTIATADTYVAVTPIVNYP